MDPRCSICANAYYNYVCPACKADPANADWLDDGTFEAPDETEPFGGKPWQPSATFVNVAQHFAANPDATLKEIAQAVGCSVPYVRHVLEGLPKLPRKHRKRVNGNAKVKSENAL